MKAGIYFGGGFGSWNWGMADVGPGCFLCLLPPAGPAAASVPSPGIHTPANSPWLCWTTPCGSTTRAGEEGGSSQTHPPNPPRATCPAALPHPCALAAPCPQNFSQRCVRTLPHTPSPQPGFLLPFSLISPLGFPAPPAGLGRHIKPSLREDSPGSCCGPSSAAPLSRSPPVGISSQQVPDLPPGCGH